jgi:hypothetical protein
MDLPLHLPSRLPFVRSLLCAAAGGALLLAACGGGGEDAASRGGAFACGLAATAAPQALLNEFGIERQTLSEAPKQLPQRLVARYAGGPATTAVVGRTDSALILGVEGNAPAGQQPGFGVLVVDPASAVRGLMIYQGLPVEGAPIIGSASIGAASIPLIGVQTDPKKIEDPKCPIFPDSELKG